MFSDDLPWRTVRSVQLRDKFRDPLADAYARGVGWPTGIGHISSVLVRWCLTGRGGAIAPSRRKQVCRVYWGSHGCHKHRGHRGVHRCVCRQYLVTRTSRRRSLPVYASGEDWKGPTL